MTSHRKMKRKYWQHRRRGPAAKDFVDRVAAAEMADTTPWDVEVVNRSIAPVAPETETQP